MDLEVTLAILYLLAGCLSTYWVEKLLVEQGYGNELGIAFTFGHRLRSVVLWPVFTGKYILDFIIIFFKNLLLVNGDDQQQT